jgi:hypothetical protein
MPNWCSNNVTVQGKIENIKAFLINVYAAYKSRSEDDVFLLLPENEMYLFQFSSYDFDILELDSTAIQLFVDTSISIAYNTRWSPNTEDMALVGKTYQLDVEHSYEEMGMGIYGEASYCAETDSLLERGLDHSDIAACTDEEGWNDWDKMEELLNEKSFN